MLTIHLNQLHFHSFHGLYEEEKKTGNDFEVNVEIALKVEERIHTLSQTVDYAEVYSIIQKRMEMPTELLETVAQDLAKLIRDAYPKIQTIHISIKKLHPPIPGFIGSVGVSYKSDQ